MKYVTIQGDTWDSIAYKTVGSEYAMVEIMKANKQYLGTLVFDGGIELNIPESAKKANIVNISSPWSE